jgi:formate transporter
MSEHNHTQVNVDALLPPQIANKAEDIGVKKGQLDFTSMFLLAVLAGAFIALGAIFCTTVITGNGLAGAIKLPFGLVKLLGGVSFCLGLILVVVAGAELFTGNNLIIMATVSGKMSVLKLLKDWFVVYVGNFVGALITVYIMFHTQQYLFAGGALGLTAIKIANGKCSLDFVVALTRGIYCNALVCLAVWLCFSCRSTTDKILAIIFPITAFVAAGFEHCVANMYFVPIGLLIKSGATPEFWAMVGKSAQDFSQLTWHNFFLVNLLPVTIGNIIGGAFFVGLIYRIIYGRKNGKFRLHLTRKGVEANQSS